MGIICIRDKKKTAEPFRDYKISDLLDKIDCVLTEHGFTEFEENIDEEAQIRYHVYKGSEGESVVRSATDDSKPILYFKGGKERARCPVYVELLQVPDSVEKSILKDLEKI